MDDDDRKRGPSSKYEDPWPGDREVTVRQHLWNRIAAHALALGFSAAAAEACREVSGALKCHPTTPMRWVRDESLDGIGAMLPLDGQDPRMFKLLRKAVQIERTPPAGLPEQSEVRPKAVPPSVGEELLGPFSNAFWACLVEARVQAMAGQRHRGIPDQANRLGYPAWLDELAGPAHDVRRLVPDGEVRPDDGRNVHYWVRWVGVDLDIFVVDRRRILGHAQAKLPLESRHAVKGRIQKVSRDPSPGRLLISQPESVLRLYGYAGAGIHVIPRPMDDE